MKIKIIDGVKQEDLEDKVNEFLQSNYIIPMQPIQYIAPTERSHWVAVITYKE
jgi:hypothetical protein